MKKLALIAMFALPLAFAACTEDNNETSVTLDKTAIELNYGENQTLKASESKGTWYSENDFVASVDSKGKVEALHEGVTNIVYQKDDAKVACKVTVNATNNSFNTITEWGVTPSYIKSIMPAEFVLLVENPTNMMYTSPANAYPWYGFFFNDNKLNGSSIYFTDAMFDQYDFNGYVKQRYARLADDALGADEYDACYANAATLTDATIALGVSYNTDDTWTAVWMPVQHTTKAAFVAPVSLSEVKALYNEAKNK